MSGTHIFPECSLQWIFTYRNCSTARALATVTVICYSFVSNQTLAKVVDGWKKHESEKVAIINQLKVERENAEQSQQRQQEVTMTKFTFSGSNFSHAISYFTCWLISMFQMLLQFEKELAQAVEALTKEQEKAAQAEKEKQTQVVKSFENALTGPFGLFRGWVSNQRERRY